MSIGVFFFVSPILWYRSLSVSAFRPCHGNMPRRKYMNMWPSASRSSRRDCSALSSISAPQFHRNRWICLCPCGYWCSCIERCQWDSCAPDTGCASSWHSRCTLSPDRNRSCIWCGACSSISDRRESSPAWCPGRWDSCYVQIRFCSAGMDGSIREIAIQSIAIPPIGWRSWRSFWWRNCDYNNRTCPPTKVLKAPSREHCIDSLGRNKTLGETLQSDWLKDRCDKKFSSGNLFSIYDDDVIFIYLLS